MDPRLLLDRKALKKELNKAGSNPRKFSQGIANGSRTPQTETSREVTQPLTPKNSAPRISSQNETSPSSAHSYDPRALLNPKGGWKLANRQTSESNHSHPRMSSSEPLSEETQTQQASPFIMSHPTQLFQPKNLLMAYHGLEERTEPAQKRIKLAKNEDGDEKQVGGGNSVHHKSNGVVGEYLKPQSVDQIQPEAINNAVVDLTNDDDTEDIDNDFEVTGSRNVLDEEVCIGALHAWVQAHLVPKPKGKSIFETPGMWPLITCSIRRHPDTKSTRIDLIDYHGAEFGRLDPDTALPLSQAMDGLRGIRTQARIVPRKKVKDDQWPHQPTSERIPVRINVYARRGDVVKLDKLFGHHNKWFQSPMNPDKGISILNPHAEKKVAHPVGLSSRPRGNVLSDTRTLEEATSEVTELFDRHAGQLSLEETEAPAVIKTPLLVHQKQALTFMLRQEQPRTFEEKDEDNSSLWRKKLNSKGRVVYEDPVSGFKVDEEPEQVFGGLLADVMGLGKTLEALALIASTTEEGDNFHRMKFVRNGESEAELMCHSKATLIVCPTSTVQNWENQIKEHLGSDTLSYYVYHGPNRIRNAYALAKYDIVVTTYGTITSDSKKPIGGNGTPLKQIKWFRIVLDEAHTIREQRTAQSEAVNKIWAQRRWCLTGTPIQNRIDDLGALTHFLRLYPYDSIARFNQYIRGPALAGDPTFLYKLRIFVDSFTLRRLRDKIDLPARLDLVQDLDFTKVEEQMHETFKKRARIEVERLAQSKEEKTGVSHHVLQAIMTLRLICAHGRDLLKEKDLKVLKGITEEEPIDIDEDETYRTIDKRTAYETLKLKADAEVDFCHQCDKRLCGDSPTAETDDEEKGARCFVLPCFDTVCADCFSEYKGSFWENAEGTDPLECPFCGLQIAAQYVGIRGSVTETLESLPDEDLGTEIKKEEAEKDNYSGPSTKSRALLKDIGFMREESKAFTDKGEPPLKCVVFSEFTSNLSLIQRDLAAEGHTFVRIDGSMSLNKRKQVLEALATDDSVTILLASIKAAGQGLNLTAASRAFIMEPMWNPAAEAQAVDRIYRIGQNREVIVKRYLIKNSIEGKIVELQKKKQQLADVTMTRNHKQLSKKEVREQHMKDIVKLFR